MRTTIDIPDELYEKVSASAKSEGKSTPQWIVNALTQGLASRPAKRASFPIIPSEREDKINLTREQVDEAVLG